MPRSPEHLLSAADLLAAIVKGAAELFDAQHGFPVGIARVARASL